MKNNKFGGILLMLIVASISLTFIACEKEEEKNEVSFLTVNGTKNAEHTFPGVFDNGKAGIDYKQVFKINSNVQWKLNGKEDWLNVSATTGNGNIELTIYPTSQNNSETKREATIVLSASGHEVSIKIIQEAGKPVCYVVPTNEVALWDRICWECEASENVNTFQWLILSENDFNRLTTKEIHEIISEEEKLKHSDSYIFFVSYDSFDNEIDEQTNYYIITLAIDKEGVEGELKSTKITTPAYYDYDNDAFVSFDFVGYDEFGFEFDVYKEGYCYTYHMIYGALPSDRSFNGALYAFQINYYLNHNKKHWFTEDWGLEIVTNYPNNHDFSYITYLPSTPLCVAYGWGVFQDGTLSSDLIGFQYDTSAYMPTYSYQMQTIRTDEVKKPKNFTIKRSEEQEKADRIKTLTSN